MKPEPHLFCWRVDGGPLNHVNSEHSSQRAKRVVNNVSSYGRYMVQNGLGFMHSVSLKSHGPVLLSMKLLPYPVNQSSQVSYRFLTAENLRLVLARGSFLLWWRGGLVP